MSASSVLAASPGAYAAVSSQQQQQTVADPFHAKLGVVTGKLVFDDSGLDLVDKKIHLYAVNIFGKETLLHRTRTNLDGTFRAVYDYNHSYLGCCAASKLLLKVITHTPAFPNHEFTHIFQRPIVLQTLNLNVKASQELQELGTLRYTNNDIPQALDQEGELASNVTQTTSYKLRLLKAALPVVAKKFIVSLAHQIPGISSLMTPARAQKLFDLSFTSYPKVAVTPAAFIQELKNEICATDYIQDDATVTWTANWDNYAFSINPNGQPNQLPNVTVVANKIAGGTAELREITIQVRGQAAVTITPQSAANDLANAIFVARSVFSIKGEASIHLAEGHLLPGIVATNFFKYLNQSNPLYQLLRPFLAGLPSIDKLGSEGIIFGKGSILDSSPLTDDAIAKLIIDAIREKADLINSVPPEPIDGTHFRAIHAKGFHTLYLNFLRDYIRDNVASLNRPDHLLHIREWSKGMTDRLTIIPLLLEDNQNYSDPAAQEKLALFLANVMNYATFLHWSAHSRQGFLLHADRGAIGMRITDFHEGMTLDPFGGAAVDDIATQLSIGRTLLGFVDLKFLQNPEGNINPELLGRVKEYIAQFPNDYDWENMSVGTAI